jgi:NADH-quinone oxidoreductase subunit E
MSSQQSVPMDKGVPRFAHGSRVPGWDTPADLDKDPATIPDPATTPVPPGLRAEIEAHMALYPETRSASLPALEAAQRVHGWCSPEAIEQVACVMRLTPADLAAVATFYDMLETEPVGRHSVYVCTNISCSLCGADALLAELENAAAAADDGKLEFNVRAFECLGACDIAPMASVDGVYVGPLTIEDVPALLDDVRAGRPVLPEKQLARKRVADPYANTREFPLHEAEHTARAGNAEAVRTPPKDSGAEFSPGEERPEPADSEGGA